MCVSGNGLKKFRLGRSGFFFFFLQKMVKIYGFIPIFLHFQNKKKHLRVRVFCQVGWGYLKQTPFLLRLISERKGATQIQVQCIFTYCEPAQQHPNHRVGDANRQGDCLQAADVGAKLQYENHEAHLSCDKVKHV